MGVRIRSGRGVRVDLKVLNLFVDGDDKLVLLVVRLLSLAEFILITIMR